MNFLNCNLEIPWSFFNGPPCNGEKGSKLIKNTEWMWARHFVKSCSPFKVLIKVAKFQMQARSHLCFCCMIFVLVSPGRKGEQNIWAFKGKYPAFSLKIDTSSSRLNFFVLIKLPEFNPTVFWGLPVSPYSAVSVSLYLYLILAC